MLTALTLLAVSVSAPSLDITALVRDAIQLQLAVFEDLENHCFLQHTLKEQPGDTARSHRTERVEEICFHQGATVHKILEIDGKPTSARPGDPVPLPVNAEDWHKRVERAREARKRNLGVMERVMEACRFYLVEESLLAGRPVVVVEMVPRPEYQANSRATEMLKHVTGRIWIDRQTHHLMMLKASVDTDFNIWGGLMAKVRRGANFELRQKPFDGDWLPYFQETTWEARVALFKNVGEHERLERSSFRRPGATAPQAR